MVRGEAPVHDAVGPADLVMLAMDDAAAVPEHLGALLILRPGPGFDLGAAERLVAERARSVARLRQRIGPGRGRPEWVEDAAFDPPRHLHHTRSGAPGDERELLDIAAGAVLEPLPRDRPLWRAVFVEAGAGVVGVVLVVHHGLADGIGGLAVLERLLDDTRPPSPGTEGTVAPEARAGTARSPRGRRSRVTAALRALRLSVAASGGLHAERAAACSLLAPTGSRRRFATVEADLVSVREAAHRAGGSVNDALLAVTSAALGDLLAHRGESVDTFRIAVPVAGRRSASPAGAGNAVAPLVVGIPARTDPAETVRTLAPVLATARRRTTAPAPIVLLWPLFRLLAATGLYHWYMTRQHRIHTLVSNVRGPDRVLHLAGAPVARIVPLSVGEAGNTTVNFVALSYAGTLTVSIVADPDQVPDLAVLTDALRARLAALVTSPFLSQARRARGTLRAGPRPGPGPGRRG
ncbi:wax ester/triacylglycerol synthase domain-containing protein [Pseudonocardia sp. T1-2H]|uniref:wax ester/triacylglycerol synthase domain-containing protein n=1 Tax=Pseudonocardia sp. T1-2H TaxID=3128899 RepID=UPI0031011F1B